MVRKLCCTMQDRDRGYMLLGLVEVDGALAGGKRAVLFAVERRGQGAGYLAVRRSAPTRGAATPRTGVDFHIKWNRFPRLIGCLKSGFPGLRRLIVTKYHAWLTQNMVLFALNSCRINVLPQGRRALI